jgi:hypothetical protein
VNTASPDADGGEVEAPKASDTAATIAKQEDSVSAKSVKYV